MEQNASFTEWSEMFLDSKENQFLGQILRPRKRNFGDLRWQHGRLLAEALRRTPEALELAASAWKVFVSDYFRDRPVPDWPQYVEIQEGLGLYGRSPFERTFRKLKRTAQKRLNVLWDAFCEGWRRGWK